MKIINYLSLHKKSNLTSFQLHLQQVRKIADEGATLRSPLAVGTSKCNVFSASVATKFTGIPTKSPFDSLPMVTVSIVSNNNINNKVNDNIFCEDTESQLRGARLGKI